MSTLSVRALVGYALPVLLASRDAKTREDGPCAGSAIECDEQVSLQVHHGARSAIASTPGGGDLDSSTPCPGLQLPLTKGMSHNDYACDPSLQPGSERPAPCVPIKTAWENGLCGIEVDYFVKGNELLVAHDWEAAVQGGPTVQSMYLDVFLKDYLDMHKSKYLYPSAPYFGACTSAMLMFDAKDSANVSTEKQWDMLHEVLLEYQARYPGLFTEWTLKTNDTSFLDGPRVSGDYWEVTPGTFEVFQSGSRPDYGYVARIAKRVMGLDGRYPDLEAGKWPREVLPLVSDAFCDVIGCDGVELPEGLTEEHKQKLCKVVTDAHKFKYKWRFWATPDASDMWDVLFGTCSGGVDVVSTDFAEAFNSYVRSKGVRK